MFLFVFWQSSSVFVGAVQPVDFKHVIKKQTWAVIIKLKNFLTVLSQTRRQKKNMTIFEQFPKFTISFT